MVDKDRSEGVAVRERDGLGSAWCVGKDVGRAKPCDTSLLQAIMLSICLQSMVDELMVKKSGGSIRKVRAGAGCCLEGDPILPLGLPGVSAGRCLLSSGRGQLEDPQGPS